MISEPPSPPAPAPPPPSLRLRIDSEALAQNWRTLNRMSGSAKAGAAIKADCYGLGIEQCLPVLRDAGAEAFFVAHWSEIADAARHVDPAQISVLHGIGSEADATYARATGARPVINSLEQAGIWIATAPRGSVSGGPCDLMVDTGINRLGLSFGEIDDPVVARLDVVTLMSHLSSADEDSDANGAQRRRFEQAARIVPAQYRSLSNSAGIALGSAYAFDITRPGLSLYGGIPRPELSGAIRQVAFPQAAIIQVRNLEVGDSVGYNGKFTAKAPMRVGVVSLGYADGFLRCWAGDLAKDRTGASLVRGERQLPVFGTVSMDMVVVDLSHAPDLREGDWLDVPYYLPDAARQSGLSQYELLTVLGQRFGRSIR